MNPITSTIILVAAGIVVAAIFTILSLDLKTEQERAIEAYQKGYSGESCSSLGFYQIDYCIDGKLDRIIGDLEQ